MRPEAIHKTLQIFFALLDAGEPLRLSEIERATKFSHQLLGHHLPNMIKDGLIVPLDIDGEKYYTVQFVFLNTTLFTKLSEAIIPIVRIVGENISYEYADGEKQDIIRNCLITFVIAASRGVNDTPND